MTNLPDPILNVFAIFSQLFSHSVYKNALQIFCGHILCKGRRTIADILRHLGLQNVKNYSRYHWVLSGAKWSLIKGSKILLQALLKLCPKDIIISIDSTIERRKGVKIKGLGRQRDPVNSTKKNKVLTVGLNWLVCAIHVKFPWSINRFACPFFSVLMPPEHPLSTSKNKSDLSKKRRHKPLNKWASQLVHIFANWIGKNKDIVFVADSSFATYQLANTCVKNGVSFISRMRMDARTFDFPIKKRKGRPCLVGKRLPTFNQIIKDPTQNWTKTTVKWYGKEIKEVSFLTGVCLWYGYVTPVKVRWVLVKTANEVVVLFSTNTEHTSEYIIEIFVERWKIETTFEECRRHLGVETQRQWNDNAIDRTTPCLFASYSIINLMAYELAKNKNEQIPTQIASWYQKESVCFSDVLSYLRSNVLNFMYFSKIGKKRELRKNSIEEIFTLLAAA